MALIPPMLTARPQNNPLYASSSSTAGVTQILAGDASITVSPVGGTGIVTLTVPAGPSTFAAGMIMMWNSPTAPDGWALCDGAAGRPDLTDRFVVGAGNLYSYDQTGGAVATSLTLDMIPDHTHGGAATQGSGGTAGINDYNVANFTGSTTGISNAGYTPGTQVPTLPPYIGIYYIIKL